MPVSQISTKNINFFSNYREEVDIGNLRNDKNSLLNKVIEELAGWKPVDQTAFADAPFQVIDFFSGCGGMSLGFAALSKVLPAFKMLGGCDINSDAASSYCNNFGAPGIVEDIRTLAQNDAALKSFLNKLNGYDPAKPLILIGCAPCQGFTSHRKKHWSKEDERNSLVATFAKMATKLNPECIIMENVPEMLSKKYWPEFEKARSIFANAGYIVKQSIYNCAAFGVPQERFRTLVIAMKKDFLMPEPPLSPHQFRTVRDAIGSLPPLKPGQKNRADSLHFCASHRQSTIDTIKFIPKNGGSRPAGVGPKCLDKIKGFSDVYGRLYWDRPSITITHYARNPASGRFVHPAQHRGLSMREAALLQGFPYGFSFAGKFDSIFKQIGEAVPPLFGCGVAVNVLTELLSAPPTAEQTEANTRLVDSPVSNSYSSVIAGLKSKNKKRNRFTCVDCFAGVGGLSLGLQKAGFNVLLSFDIDEKCIQTQRLNKKYLKHESCAASIDDMLNGGLLNKIDMQRGELFLLAGGPPCQGFSMQRVGPDTDKRNELVLKYLRLIEEVYPQFFIIENVPGIMGKRGKKILDHVLKKAEGLGYWIHMRVLNAQDYGVPQRRRRVFIVGERKGDSKSPSFKFPTPIGKKVTVKDAIGHLPPTPKDGTEHPAVPNHKSDRLSAMNQKRLMSIKGGQGREHLPKKLLNDCHKVDASVMGHRNVYGRMSWDDVAPTITARFDSFTRGQFGHPDQLRTISLREGALLQTFPDDFKFTGNKVEIARQIGNAVPVLLAKAVGTEIIKAVDPKKSVS